MEENTIKSVKSLERSVIYYSVSTSRSFSMSITLWIFLGWLLSLILILTELFQTHVEWILPTFFNYLHLLDNWWFSWYMLSEMKSLPEKSSWLRTSDLLQRFFLLIRMLRFCFLHLNLTITMSFFFKRWHAWKSSGLISWPLRDNALQTLLSRTSSLIDEITGFNGVPLQLDNSFTQKTVTVFTDSWLWRKNFISFQKNNRNDWWDQIA